MKNNIPNWFEYEDFKEPLKPQMYRMTDYYNYKGINIKLRVDRIGNCDRFPYGNCVFYMN